MIKKTIRSNYYKDKPVKIIKLNGMLNQKNYRSIETAVNRENR